MSLGPKVVYEFGPFRLDPDKQILLRGGEPVAITPKAIDTLLVLIRNSRQVVSKDELLKSVWPDAFVEESNLSQNIFIVRKALGDTPEDRRYILTLPGRGYRFVADVHTVTQEGDDVVIRGHSHSKVIIEQADRTTGAWPATANEGGDSRIERSSEKRSDPGIDRRERRRASKAAAIPVLVSVLLVAIAVWPRPSKDSTIGKDESPLVLMPLLALPGEERMPALALDGSRIAFVRHAPLPKDSGIWTEVIGSQSLLQLSHNPNDSHPAWSPDGRFVAFLRNTADEFAIELIASLGGEERRLHTGRQTPFESPTSLSFSADGRQLAFTEWDVATQQSSIKLISIFDGSIRTLTSPPPSYHDAAPAFSPDGKSIAFVRSTGPILVDDIFVVPAKGGEARQITFDRRRMFSAPAWISGGRELMFSSTRAGMKALWRVPARGGAPKLVSGSGPQTDNPSVSWSRGELAYEYSIEEENLWRVDVEGRTHAKGAATALLAPKTSNLMPHFSPDGRKIAFESDRSGYEEIWICDADGTNPAQVTRLERYSGSPRWSPDGRYLAFDFRSEQHSEIYTVEVASRRAHSIARFPDADNVVPRWSRDGRWIYFASNHGTKDFHLWRVPSEGGKAARVTRGPGFAGEESLDGTVLYYTRFSEPGLWKIPRDGGPEVVLSKDRGPDNWANWVPAKDGIYLMETEPPTGSTLQFLNLQTGKLERVASLQRPSFYGLTMDLSGQALVYSQRDRTRHDIIVMMNFH